MGPPCDSSNVNKLSGLMALDDFAFSGLQEAVLQMARIIVILRQSLIRFKGIYF